jgi:hypothetical protein
MYLVFRYENRRIKSVEIVLRREESRGGRKMEGVNLTKIYCKHIHKYHNVPTVQLYICVVFLASVSDFWAQTKKLIEPPGVYKYIFVQSNIYAGSPCL